MANKQQLELLKRRGVKVWNQLRRRNRYDSSAKLNKIDLSNSALHGIDLMEANLSDARLCNVLLQSAKLRRANLERSDLRGSRLMRADLKSAKLKNATLCNVDFTGANLSNADLQGANLTGARLVGANLSGANLNRADLRGADISQANLIGTRALATNFERATFTGACLQDWHTNSATNLNKVSCKYVYLRKGQGERLPHDLKKDFALGEFTKMFTVFSETIDLLFDRGIDLLALNLSLKDLQKEACGQKFEIRTFENKGDEALLIKLNIPSQFIPHNFDKARAEKHFWSTYGKYLRRLSQHYREKLNLKEEEIARYRQESTKIDTILEVVKEKQSNPIVNIFSQPGNVEQIMSSNYDQKINLAGATINGGVAGGNYQGDVVNNYLQQSDCAKTLAEDIQKLWNKLSEVYPTGTIVEKATLATEVVKQIEQDLTLRQRVLRALKSGSIKALEELLSNPAASFVIAALQDWQDSSKQTAYLEAN